MEASDSANVRIPESCLDFSFGFDNSSYSDRTLLLQIADRDNTTTAPRVKTVHIDSLILAARSLFFRKLFSNGMLESGQKVVTLWIEASEEVSIMDLLKYVYSNNLPTTLDALLNLLVIADKFEVASCLRDCTRLLQNMPMTCESASLYLDLPPGVQMSPTVQPLIDATKQFLVAHFKDLDQCKDEILNLSLACIQVVLSRNDLQVTSEGVVYESVLKWAQTHYSNLEERREILKTHLLDLVRFPFMTLSQLTEVQTCSDIYPELASQLVICALYFKSETPHRMRCLAAEEANVVSHQYLERAYKYRPVKVVELELPHQHYVVFFHLTGTELKHIFPNGKIMSETFYLDKQELAFVGRCILDSKSNQHYFWLGLKLVGSAAIFPVKYEIAVRKKPSEKFVSWKEGRCTFTDQGSAASVVSVWWTILIGGDSTYFINDVLHMRTELTTEI